MESHRKGLFIKALAVSLLLHIIAVIGVYSLVKNENLLAKNEPKKVKLSYKRGGDFKLENSPHKLNSAIPEHLLKQQDSPHDSTQGIAELNLTKDSAKTARDSTDSAKKDSTQKLADSTQKDSAKSPTAESLNLSSLQIYNNASFATNTRDTNYKNAINYIASRQAPSDVKQEIFELYGDELGDYGLAEIDFLLDNLRDIGRITQYHINRRGFPQAAKLLNQQGKNIIEFYLHPNGDISNLRVVSSANSVILDNDMMTNIKVAFREYPRPTTKVKIRFYMEYILR